MPLQIIKLAVTADASTEVMPTVDRFFYIAEATTTGASTLTIPVEDFMTDTGAAATTLPALLANNSYYNVYINGVLQMEDISTYTAGGTGVGEVEITVPAGSTIEIDTPVVVEVVNFDTATVVGIIT